MKGKMDFKSCEEGTKMLLEELANLLTTIQIINSNEENGKTM